jgi:hypothetical protein
MAPISMDTRDQIRGLLNALADAREVSESREYLDMDFERRKPFVAESRPLSETFGDDSRAPTPRRWPRWPLAGRHLWASPRQDRYTPAPPLATCWRAFSCASRDWPKGMRSGCKESGSGADFTRAGWAPMEPTRFE